MTITIAVTNQKGGVGKTTLAFNFAHSLVSKGYKVLLVDNDPQGNLTSSALENADGFTANLYDVYNEDGVKITPQIINPNLSLIGADENLAKIAERDFQVIYRLKEYLEKIKNDYDFIIIDCLPSFGYLHVAPLVASDYILIPMQLSPYSIAGLKTLMKTFRTTQQRLNPNLRILGIVLNAVEETTIDRELEETLKESCSSIVFNTKITKAVRLKESPAFQKSILEYAPESKSAQQITSLTEEILTKLKLTKRKAA
jgi:chromosome partitioning protein